MKKLSFLALAAAGMLFGACSSDNDVAQLEDGTRTYEEGEGFLSLSINLPTTPLTRAANDIYDDGLANEYKVSDACLLLFTGTSEAEATLMNAQPLTLPFDATDEDATDNDNLSTSYQTVAEVLGTLNGNLYALVCLNYKNVLTISGGEATIAGTTTKVSKLADIQSTAANVVAGNKGVKGAVAATTMFTNKNGAASSDYFFMTNAVQQYADADAKAAAPQASQILTLSVLDATKIYKTEAEAKENPAGVIYVERAVAKATLNSTATKLPGTVGGTSTPLDIKSVMWAIDNIEPTSFIVRNPGDKAYIAYSSEAFDVTGSTTKAYRFVGDVKMGTTATLHPAEADIYRTYWCVDPSYNVDGKANMTAAPAYVDKGTPLYCNENTFDVVNQNYGNTTRAIIKVTPTTDADFYTVNGGQERYTEADAKSYIISDIVDNPAFQNAVKACLLADKTYTFSAASITPTWSVDAATAQVTMTGIAKGDMTATDFDITRLDAAFNDTDIKEAVTAANSNYKVLKYTNGIVYYEARFEHFANTAYEKSLGTFAADAAKTAGDLAPWNCWEATTKPSSTTAYPNNTKTAEENYLGRYGMVRNNWYDVTITAFNKLGSPVDPTGKIDNPGTPDDNVKEYISVKINVLSWAKRTQSWSF